MLMAPMMLAATTTLNDVYGDKKHHDQNVEPILYQEAHTYLRVMRACSCRYLPSAR